MKTLKQRMETELDSSLYLCHDFNEIETEFLRLTKEWLTQKQQPVEGMSMRNNVKALLVLQGRQQMLSELLEEIKQ